MKTLYFILGCLDEYMGRLVAENGDVVERFYASERDAAEIFKTSLLKLAEEHHLDPAIEDEGGLVFRSPALTALIDARYNSFFSGNSYPAFGSDPALAAAYISIEVFESGDREAKLSYLAGAHTRYGDGTLFRFANARHKAELIRDLLEELGCGPVELVHANPGYVPSVFEVGFRPSEELASWLWTEA